MKTTHLYVVSTLCLQHIGISTILDETNIYKPDAKNRIKSMFLRNFIENEMVGVTGIEPVTPTMST